MSVYKIPKDFAGYEAGTELRDVTLAEARAMECNRCGDCCNGLSPDVKKDPATGLPLVTWGSKFPDDLYESRYGQKLLQPIVMIDGDIGIGDAFEVDPDNKPYTCFKCSMLVEHHDGAGEGPQTSCALLGLKQDPKDISTLRPLNCGEFPVFGNAVGDALIGGHNYVPMTGALPRCTWYGLRIVGPYKDSPYWRDRWARQQQGLDVPDLSIPTEFIQAMVEKHGSKTRSNRS